jgi:plastocyanin
MSERPTSGNASPPLPRPAAAPPKQSRRGFLKLFTVVGGLLVFVPWVPTMGSYLLSSAAGATTATRNQTIVLDDNTLENGSASRKTVNMTDLTTFPPNSTWIMTYPSSGNPTTDGQNPNTFVKFVLIGSQLSWAAQTRTRAPSSRSARSVSTCGVAPTTSQSSAPTPRRTGPLGGRVRDPRTVRAPLQRKSSVGIPVTIAAIIIIAVTSVGYFQFVQCTQATCSAATSSSSSALGVRCAPPQCVTIQINYGAATLTTTAYSPDTAKLVIGVNNTLEFHNNDSESGGVDHTATADGCPKACPFDTGVLSYNQTSAIFTIATPGTYPYYCEIHPTTMKGTIIVVAESGSAAVSSTTTTSTASSKEAAPPRGAQITIASGASANQASPGLTPDTATVVIGVNNTVNWINDDTVGHTIIFTSEPSGANVANGGIIGPGLEFRTTFTVPGTYHYKDGIDSWIKGTIAVVAGSGKTTSSSSSSSSSALVSTATTSIRTGASSSTATGAKGVAVSIPKGAGNPSGAPGYSPDMITLVMGLNATVTWTNDDTVPHTVTANNMTAGVPVFDSGNLNPGQSFTYTFTTSGTYLYHCDYHSWMTGTVVVKGG